MSNKPHLLRCPAQKRRSGTALVAALIVVMTMTVMITSFALVSTNSSRQINRQADLDRLERGAESVIALAVDRLWGGYIATQGGQPGSILSFRAYLEGNGIMNSPVNTDIANTPGTEVSGLLALPAGTITAAGIGSVDVQSVSAVRIDEPGTTTFYLSATVTGTRGARVAGSTLRHRVSQAFVTEGAEWQGLDFALLANNVNCIMCHAEIGSADRYYNSDLALYNSFDRIKIGTLESLLLRSGNGSTVGGTMYVRGQATNKDGSPVTDWPGMGMFSTSFDANGKVAQDAWGDPSLVNFSPADASNPQSMGNLYLDYSMDDASMVDGLLPQSFPETFPDDGGIDPLTGAPYVGAAGNRVVDPGEFEAAVYDSVGALSGGSIFVSAPGAILDTQTKLSAALSAGNQLSLPSITTGNVVLTGTAANPIVLNGDIAIDGDLIIQGVIKGEGSLKVSGNVYLPSNLTYADGTVGGVAGAPRTFGTAANGTANSLAIAAGGSIAVGDLFYSKKGAAAPSGFEEGTVNFVTSELALFNRSEWTKTQEYLPGKSDPMSNPSSWTQLNPSFDPNYTPRYYTLADGGDVPFFVPLSTSSSGNTVWFDAASGSWQGKEHGKGFEGLVARQDDPSDSILFAPGGAPKAAIHSLSTASEWVPYNLLQDMMKAAVLALPPGEPLNIDATLYSNNSIFGIIGKTSPAAGQMIVNGAIVAADVGLLVPGNGGTGLTLNYDTRGKSLLHLKSNNKITFRRKLVMASGSVHP